MAERDTPVDHQARARAIAEKADHYCDFCISNERHADESRRELAAAIAAYGATVERETLERAFKAGYHCRWHREQGEYCFDPAMSPGDPDGAFQAWLRAEGRTV